METWLKLTLLVGLIVVLVGLVLPRQFHIERQVLIFAPREAIHPLVEDLTQWPRWSPWISTEMPLELGQITAGVGASQQWRDKHGGGRLAITHSHPDDGIRYDILFARNTRPQLGQIRYLPRPDGATEVVWEFNGQTDTSVFGAYFALMARAMIGSAFQKGLTQLKREVEVSGRG